MRINYPRNQFLSQLFPSIDISNDEQLEHAFRKYLTLGEYSPKVELTDSEVIIEIPSNFLLGISNKYTRATDQYMELERIAFKSRTAKRKRV